MIEVTVRCSSRGLSLSWRLVFFFTLCCAVKCSVTVLRHSEPFQNHRPWCHPPSSLPPCSCAFNRVLHEAEEEDVKPREQPQLLEQRHHHGLLQQARRGAAQRDSHPGERGTYRGWPASAASGFGNSQFIHVQSVWAPLSSSCCGEGRGGYLSGFLVAWGPSDCQ